MVPPSAMVTSGLDATNSNAPVRRESTSLSTAIAPIGWSEAIDTSSTSSHGSHCATMAWIDDSAGLEATTARPHSH
jgi:hypothetical protein